MCVGTIVGTDGLAVVKQGKHCRHMRGHSEDDQARGGGAGQGHGEKLRKSLEPSQLNLLERESDK